MLNDTDYAKMYLSKISSCEKRGVIFDLTFAEYKKLMKVKRCAYSGEKFSEYKECRPIDPWRGHTIDRIDNTKGYVKGNVVAAIKGANDLKSIWENPINPLDLRMVQRIIDNVNKRLTSERT